MAYDYDDKEAHMSSVFKHKKAILRGLRSVASIRPIELVHPMPSKGLASVLSDWGAIQSDWIAVGGDLGAATRRAILDESTRLQPILDAAKQTLVSVPDVELDDLKDTLSAHALRLEKLRSLIDGLTAHHASTDRISSSDRGNRE